MLKSLLLAIAIVAVLAGVLWIARIVEQREVSEKAKTLAEQGSDAEDKGDYDRAIQLFTDGLQLESGSAQEAWLHTERGNIYFDEEDYDTALKDYEEAIRLDPENVRAFVGRGNARDEKGDRDKAITDYTEAIRLDPKYAPAYINLAVTYSNKGMYDEAIAECNTALGIDPQSPDAYENRAIGYDGKNERDKAMADYAKVMELEPKYAEAYVNRARDFRNAGAYDKAAADLNTAVRIDPKYAAACNGLAWLLATCPQAELRDGRKAVDYALQACGSSEWKRASDVDTLAAAYAETGDFDNAVKFEQWYLGFDGLAAESVADGKARLALYEAHKPYHEEKKQ